MQLHGFIIAEYAEELFLCSADMDVWLYYYYIILLLYYYIYMCFIYVLLYMCYYYRRLGNKLCRSTSDKITRSYSRNALNIGYTTIASATRRRVHFYYLPRYWPNVQRRPTPHNTSQLSTVSDIGLQAIIYCIYIYMYIYIIYYTCTYMYIYII